MAPLWGTGIFLLLSAAFVGVLGYTISLFVKTEGQKTDSDLDSMMMKIGYMNGALIALMMLISFSFLNTNPALKDKYLLVMTHVAVFFSIMAFSFSAIVKRTA